MKAKTKTYVVNEDGKVSRWETFKARVRDKVDDAKEFYYDHEMEIKLGLLRKQSRLISSQRRRNSRNFTFMIGLWEDT